QTSLARLSCFTFAALLLPPAAAIAGPTNLVNRFTAAARLTFNASVTFDRIGGYVPRAFPGPATGGPLDRFYDDGYVGVDADHNAGGLTWFWGYRDASQVSGDNLLLNSSSLGSTASSQVFNDGPVPGFEIAWLRELHRNEHFATGFKLAFNYANLSICDNRPLGAPIRRLTDTYSLGGITPPGNPSAPGWQYQATRDQGLDNEAPVIDDVPASRVIHPAAGTASITGTRTLDARIFGWKLGPWIELPLTSRLSLQAGGGLSWAVVDSRFGFTENTTLPGAGTTSLTGNNSQADPVIGAYAEAGLFYNFTERFGVFVLGEFQHLNSAQQTVLGRSATINLGQTWSLQTGLGFSF
ncbi:MAG: hypothetical protein HYZ36_00115, partial [Pedosphaera parvula]|nr:hypothetical protein [Pedosphaera parvula]